MTDGSRAALGLMRCLLPHPHLSAQLGGSPSLCPARQKVTLHPRRGEVKEGTWEEVTISARIPFRTTRSQMEEEGNTSATGLCRLPHLGEPIHSRDETSPTFAQLWRKASSSFNTKKVQIVCSPWAMIRVGK